MTGEKIYPSRLFNAFLFGFKSHETGGRESHRLPRKKKLEFTPDMDNRQHRGYRRRKKAPETHEVTARFTVDIGRSVNGRSDGDRQDRYRKKCFKRYHKSARLKIQRDFLRLSKYTIPTAKRSNITPAKSTG